MTRAKQNDLYRELTSLLSETESAAAERARDSFDTLAGPARDRLVLYGAGNLGRKTVAGLRSVGIEPLAFSDGNAALWGSTVDGVAVMAPEDAVKRYGDNAAFIITIWGGAGLEPLADRKRTLEELGARTVFSFGYLYWKYPAAFLPHYAFDLPERLLQQRDAVERAFSLWSDDASRAEYVAQVRWRLTLDFDGLPAPVEHATYLAPDLYRLRDDEVFIDCGAYDGDTIAAVLENTGSCFERMIAFEPDALSFVRCEQYLASLAPAVRKKIELRQLALGAVPGTVTFSQTGTPASSVVARSADLERIDVPCVRLDDVLNGANPTFIKMDIEGAEPDALRGAANTIAGARPILTVCSYHQQDHLWAIPLLINEITPEYQFFLRPHLLEVWDLVCYAVPPNRLIREGAVS
jgi:FkbM family methyltransferase